MAIILFTPGHGDPLDTLILNGMIITLLEEYPKLRVEVLKQASRFFIKILNEDNIDEEKVITNAMESVITDYELGNQGKIKLASRPQPATKEIGGIIEEAFSQARFKSFIKEYSRETHIIENNEGRKGRKKGLFKSYLQLAPFTGSFLRVPYMTVGTSGRTEKERKAKEADYVICPLCLIFSLVGLIKSTSIITYSTKKKESVLFILPSPINAFHDDIALLISIFGEKIENISKGREIPALGGILYSMVSGETPSSISPQSLFNVIYWIYAKERNFISIRSFDSIPFSNIYKFITEAKRRSPHLVRMVELIAKHEPELLELLVETLVYPNYDVYNTVRSLWNFLDDFKKKYGWTVPLDEGIIDALIKTSPTLNLNRRIS